MQRGYKIVVLACLPRSPTNRYMKSTGALFLEDLFAKAIFEYWHLTAVSAFSSDRTLYALAAHINGMEARLSTAFLD